MSSSGKRIKANQELKRKAVGFKSGVSVNPPSSFFRELEEVIESSADEFVIEVGRELMRLRSGYEEAARDPEKLPTFREEALEASYAVKSLGGTFGFPLLTAIAKSLNDYLQDIERPHGKQWQIIGLHIDALYVVLVQQIRGGGGDVEQQVLSAFNWATEQFK